MGEPVVGLSSTRTSVINGINNLAGMGAYSSAFALAQSGWAGLVVLALFGLMWFYTGVLLEKSMRRMRRGDTSFPDLGEIAFGRAGRYIISILLYMELYFTSAEFLILQIDSLEVLIAPHVN